MRAKVQEKLRAIELRKQGDSITEIADCLNVSNASVSTWVRNIKLSSASKTKLHKKFTESRIQAGKTNRENTKSLEQHYLKEEYKRYKKQKINTPQMRLMCALIYWCEGAKNTNRVEFTNSDPDLVKTFLKLFRSSFILNENRFRVCLHLHEYHNEQEQLEFWSQTTNIPLSKFTVPYIKSHTGKRKKENYQGCISVRYHEANMARVLHSIVKAWLKLDQ